MLSNFTQCNEQKQERLTKDRIDPILPPRGLSLMKASLIRHSRESGNPVSFSQTQLGPRFRGDDDLMSGSEVGILYYRGARS